MTEKKQAKADEAILNTLLSPDKNLVSKTIKRIGDSGNSAYLPALIAFFCKTDSTDIQNEIRKLLSEIKHSDAVPVLVEAIQNKEHANNLHTLVSICWENGLDYSEYFSSFIDLAIEQDFMVAFEAHTVIMNMSGKISQAIADKESNKIKHALIESDESKKQLLNDLLDFIPVFVQGIEPQQY